MKYVLVRRAIIIALLFILSPANSFADQQADTPASNSTELNKPGASVVDSSNQATMAEVSSVAGHDSEENKGKLTIFFAIGFVINIILMSLFGYWAVSQWRKSGNKGKADQ